MENKKKKQPEELSEHDWEILLGELSQNSDHGWETPKDQKKRKLDFFTDILIILFFLFIVVVFFFATISLSFNTNSTSSSTKTESGWIYVRTANSYEPKVAIAWLNSENSIKLPSGKSSSFTLNIRKCEKGTDIFLTSSNSMFVSGYSIPIKFDKKGTFRVYVNHETRFKDSYSVYSYSYFPEGSSEAVFFNFKINSFLGTSTPKELITEEDFISKLRTTDKLIIDIELLNEGKQQIEFSTKGLNWEYIEE